MTATETTDAAAVDYRLGTGAPSGVWLGLGSTRLALLAAGLLTTVALLAARVALALGVIPLLAAAAVTLLPVAGRPLAAWAGPVAAHAAAGAGRSTRWCGPLTPVTLAGGEWREARRLRLPPEFGRVRLAEASDGPDGWPLAVLSDGRGTGPVLCFAVAGTDRFSLLDPADQDRLLAGWGRALTTLSQRDGGVVHAQLLGRAAAGEPATGAAVSWAGARGGDAAALAGVVDAVSVRRDSVLAVRLAGTSAPTGAAQRAREVAAQLLAAELPARPLDAAETGDLFARLLAAGQSPPSTPVSRRTGWDHVRTDDTWHRSYAVAGWPGSPVPAGWLAPLLLAVPPVGAWTVALHLSAVPPEHAARLARAARTRAELDRADRTRLGLAASAAADRAVVESAGMDAELIAGHGTHRLAAVFTCSAGSPAELDECARGLRDAATGAGLRLAPLHGQHHLGLAATAPLCRLRFGGAA